MQLTVCCYQWNSGFRAYTPEQVNILAGLFRRFLARPHRFVCISDEKRGFAPWVDVLPLPDEAKAGAAVLSPEGPRFPSSYRRLWTFSESAKCLGDVVLMTDIDCVPAGPIDPLIDYMFEHGADFVGWQPSSIWGVERRRFGGGTWLLRTGTRTEVWTSFSARAAGTARGAGFRGSDQAYISYCLADKEISWPQHCGIYQAQQMKGNGFRVLPQDARLVHFNGKVKPWDLARHVRWIGDLWRLPEAAVCA